MEPFRVEQAERERPVSRSLVASVVSVVNHFYSGPKGAPALPARLLSPLFRALSLETQLFLAREVTLGRVAASLEAKERWGDAGNVVVAGNEVRVGMGDGEKFVILGRGPSWAAAFANAARRERPT
jgi:hypothetical protein